MKQIWKNKKLFEICDFSNGLWTGKKPPFQNVGVIRNTNFTKDGMLDDSDIVYLDVEQSQFAKRRLQYGDIILEKSGGGPKQPVGRVVIFDKKEGDYSFSNFTSVIRIKNSDEVDFNYLHRYLFFTYLSGYTETMQSHSTGIRNLKFDEYKDIEIPLPPLPEQQRIVSILDKAFAAIDKAKANATQNLKNAKELFESYLQSVFENGNWEERSLGEVCEFTQGIQRDVKLQSEIQKENQVRFLRIVDFTQGNEPPRFIDNPGDKYILNSNDVSLVRYGASTGFVCRGLEGALANNLFRVIPKTKKEITNDFLFVYLNAPVFQNVIKESMNGAAMPAISFGLIKDIPFPIISLKEQGTIVQKLNALSAETKKLEAIYQKKIEDLEELKKSILQKAFSGELNTTKDIAL